MYRILKGDLNSPSKFKEKLHDYIVTLRAEILKHHNIEFDIEEDVGYDYGIMVKCSVPQQPYNFLLRYADFSRLLDFAEEKIPPQNGLFKDYIKEIRGRIRKYKCGEFQTSLKGFICGYFKTSNFSPVNSPVKEGVNLPYLGIVREERYLVSIDKLKWAKENWKEFLEEVELL